MRLLVSGELTPDEVYSLTQRVREIERNKPDRVIRVSLDAPELSEKQVSNIFQRIDPPLEVMVKSSDPSKRHMVELSDREMSLIGLALSDSFIRAHLPRILHFAGDEQIALVLEVDRILGKFQDKMAVGRSGVQ